MLVSFRVHIFQFFANFRDSVSDFTSDYKIDGTDGNFESAASHMHPHSGTYNPNGCKYIGFHFIHTTQYVLSEMSFDYSIFKFQRTFYQFSYQVQKD